MPRVLEEMGALARMAAAKVGNSVDDAQDWISSAFMSNKPVPANASPAFKKAIALFDKNDDGRISAKELRAEFNHGGRYQLIEGGLWSSMRPAERQDFESRLSAGIDDSQVTAIIAYLNESLPQMNSPG